MRLSFKYICLAAAACLCASLAACGVIKRPDTVSSAPVSAAENASSQPSSAESAAPSPEFAHIVTEESAFADELSRRAAEFIDPAVNKAIDVLNAYPDDPDLTVLPYDAADYPGGYADMTPLRKKLYERIRSAVCEYGEYSISENALEKDEGSTNGFGDIVDAVYALYHDHPEYAMYFRDDSGADLHRPRYFLPNDYNNKTEDTAAVKEAVLFYGAVFDRVLACMPEGISDYRKMVYFASVICGACTYDDEYATLYDPFPAYNALVGGTAVCQGYTQAFRLLCHGAGMYCKSMTGATRTSADDTDLHIWNLVMTSEGERFIDVTWTDNYIERSGRPFTFEYFLMNEDDLEYEGYIPDRDKIE